MSVEQMGMMASLKNSEIINLSLSTNHEKIISDSLQCAKDTILDWLREIAKHGEYDHAQILLQSAQEVDNILKQIKELNKVPAPPIKIEPPSPTPSLPYYYVDQQSDKLIKVGASRDTGTYQHGVTHEHFDLIVRCLKNISQAGVRQFETQRLINQCAIPHHEPLIVLNTLKRCNLLSNPSRGQWKFVDPGSFPIAVQGVWSKLKRARV